MHIIYLYIFLKISVSDYIGGGELLKLLQNHGPLPEELCRIYFAELVIIIGIFSLLCIFDHKIKELQYILFWIRLFIWFIELLLYIINVKYKI